MKKITKKLAITYIFAAVLFGACTKESKTTPEPSKDFKIGNTITIKNEGLYPEGIDYDETNKVFIVGSLYKGEIGKVDPETGDYTTFISGTDLIGVTGVFTDEASNRLIVAIADPGVIKKSSDDTGGKTAKIGIYDLKTGDKKIIIPLESLSEGGNFANDIALDDKGNIFVTNSFTKAEIYKIDKNNTATLYTTIAGAETTVGAFGLNGIVYHKASKKLIVGHTTNGKFYVVSEKAGTVTVEPQANFFLENVDGLEIDDEGKLIASANGTSTVVTASITINSDKSLKIKQEKSKTTETGAFPTTVANVPNKGSFVLYSHLSNLFGNPKKINRASFKIVNINSL